MTTERQEPLEQEGAPTKGGGTTQVGQVVDGLERQTRPLPKTDARRPRQGRPTRSAPPREQLTALIEALGDTSHPLHAGAVDELVAIGAPAVPALCEALNPNRPWLVSYRAAEAAGRIGDGRATSALIQALAHSNGNVRWSVIHALTQIGDVRALLELRRIAQSDQGRTSWGEPVAGAAQSALAEIGRRSVWGQSLELIKSALVAVLMLLALILAFSVVSTLRGELERFGRIIPGQTTIPSLTLPTAVPNSSVAAASGSDRAEEPAVNATETDTALTPTDMVEDTGLITGTVRQDGNVRPFPGTNNQPIGKVKRGDEVVFLAQSANGQWFLIRLGAQPKPGTSIGSDDGTGWLNQALVSPPASVLPVQQPEQTPALTPTARP